MGILRTASSDLTGLYSIFGDPLEEVPQSRFASPEEVPQPFQKLLAHTGHMTVTMEEHIGAPVNLIVIKSVRDDLWYARKILLTNTRGGDVVQFGLMRFNFDWCNDEVRDQIISGRIPLGRILIEHDVLRRVSTHALMRITPNQELRDVFGMGPADLAREGDPTVVYGRLATIFCNEEPAVDLLEVASPNL